MPLVALSYRRQDSEAITGRIFDRLTLSYGKDAIFRDIDNIPAGVDFREYISSILSRCDLLIVVIGRQWLGRSRGSPSRRIDDEIDIVRIEVETALQQKLPIIPVLVGNAQMPPASDLPETIKPLAFRNAIRVDAGQDFDNHISRLLRGVDGSIKTQATDNPQPRSGELLRPLPAAHSSRRNVSFSRNVIRLICGAAILLIGFGITVLYLQGRNAPQISRDIAPPPNEPYSPSPARPDELETLLAGTQPEALAEYLKKHPAEPRRNEIVDRISFVRRAEFTEWTVYDVSVKLNELSYLKFSSISKAGDGRFAVQQKFALDRSNPPPNLDNAPEGAYQVTEDIYDCKAARFWTSEITYYTKGDEVIRHYKSADPAHAESMLESQNIVPGSLAASARTIVCNDGSRTPLVSKQEIGENKFTSLASTPMGDGEIYYKLLENDGPGDRRALLIAKLNADRQIAEVAPASAKIALGGMTYRTMVELESFKCKENKFSARNTEFYDVDRTLKHVSIADPSQEAIWGDIVPKSRLELLRRISCGD